MITDAADRGSAQAARTNLWLRSEERYYKEQREALRSEWVSYHERLAANHRSLALEHDRAARELLEDEERSKRNE